MKEKSKGPLKGGPCLESVLNPSERRPEAPVPVRTALIYLAIRLNSCVRLPCRTERSGQIRHPAGVKSDVKTF
jgi:hypothetical protein